MAIIFEFVASGLELRLGRSFVAKDHAFAPVILGWREVVVHLKGLFLVVEDIDNNTDEHVEDEE